MFALRPHGGMRLPPVLASGQPKGSRRNSFVSSFVRAPAVPHSYLGSRRFPSPSLRLPRLSIQSPFSLVSDVASSLGLDLPNPSCLDLASPNDRPRMATGPISRPPWQLGARPNPRWPWRNGHGRANAPASRLPPSRQRGLRAFSKTPNPPTPLGHRIPLDSNHLLRGPAGRLPASLAFRIRLRLAYATPNSLVF